MGQKINPIALRAGRRFTFSSSHKHHILLSLIDDIFKSGGVLTSDLFVRNEKAVDRVSKEWYWSMNSLNRRVLKKGNLSRIQIKGLAYEYKGRLEELKELVERLFNVELRLTKVCVPITNAKILNNWIGLELLTNSKNISEKKILKRLFARKK